MKVIKSDWAILQEAEAQGYVASMTCIVERIRTTLNNELSAYFRSQMPNYLGSFDEEEAEDVLYGINQYLKEHDIDKFKQPINFPYSTGSKIYLIPLTEHLQAKVLVVNEYYGDGDYEKYVNMSYFVIDEQTTKEDVDKLIAFLKRITAM